MASLDDEAERILGQGMFCMEGSYGQPFHPNALTWRKREHLGYT
jgi:hypothetical protein